MENLPVDSTNAPLTSTNAHPITMTAEQDHPMAPFGLTLAAPVIATTPGFADGVGLGAPFGSYQLREYRANAYVSGGPVQLVLDGAPHPGGHRAIVGAGEVPDLL